MRKIMKQIRTLLLSLAFLILLTGSVLAADYSIRSDKTTYEPGDTVTVTVTFSASQINGVQASISHDSSGLEYLSGASSSTQILWDSDTPRESSYSVAIKYKALKDGSPKVTVSNVKITTLMEDFNLGESTKAVTVNIETPEPDPEPTTPSKPTTPTKPSTPTTTVEPEPEPDPMENAIEVTVLGEKAYLWPDLSDVELPEGFELGNTTFQEQDIQVATRMQVSLAYLTDEEGENGTFWNYNVDTQELYSFVEFTTQGSYVFLQADEELTAPEGYSPTSVEINGEMLQGWIADDNQLQDFILLYATNNKGEEGFYLYDLEEGTMQRFGQRIVEVEVEIEPEPRSVVQRIFDDPVIAGILSALGLIVAGLAVSFARVVQKNKKSDSE